MKPFTSRHVDLRGLSHRVLTWGPPDAPKLFLLHGWMDVGASFQFLVDAMEREWRVIAPDLRGFGGTQWQPQGYWFADYLADVEALLDRMAPGERVHLAGHSLGGNIALLYAGVRPQRVAKVVSLDAFGIRAEDPSLAPTKIARWLDALRSPPAFRTYANMTAVAVKLQTNNPRLTPERAAFLAREWAEELPDGTARLRSDPRHKLPFPSVYRVEETYAVWRCITAPTLWIAAEHSHATAWLAEPHEDEGPMPSLAAVRRRLAHIAHGELVTIADAGHMLHHDQPEAVARVLEAFLTR
jgi:pimeloyl-ACP methyl ester carboxylesterase